MNRFRERGGYSPRTGTYVNRNVTCTSGDQSGSYSMHPQGVYESTSDVVIPGFHKRVARGEVFFNPYTHTFHSAGVVTGTGNRRRQSNVRLCSGVDKRVEYILNDSNVGFGYQSSVGGPILPSPVMDSSELASFVGEATTECLARRDAARGSLAESAAEIRQSLGMPKGILAQAEQLVDAQLHTYYRDKKKLIISRVLSPAKAARDLYLMYRYGLRPLLNDFILVSSGLDAYVGTQRITTRALVSHEASRESTGTWSYSSGVDYFNYRTTDTVSVRAMSLDEYRATLSSNVGISIKGVMSLPWDLIPYSFVADMFANLGSFYKALLPTPGLNSLGGCVVVRRVLTLHGHATNSVGAGGLDCIAPDTGSLTAVTAYTTRTVGLAGPSLHVKSDFRLDEATRIADLSALISQKIRNPLPFLTKLAHGLPLR